ncbi:MAG: ATP12 family chaperone protein [Alphaproteobacteria bacterium]
MTVWRARRTYQAVAVVECRGGYGIALDGKPITTPEGRPLVLPSRPLAQALAAEWQAQGQHVGPLAMPLTRLAGSAIDLVGPHRAAVVERTAAYAETDLLCYRALGPEALAERQQVGWQTVVDWVAQHFEAPLRVTAGIVAIEQPALSLATLRRAVEASDDLRLTALTAATAACGSLILGLALAEGEIAAEAAWALSELDESYQIELWGEDPEARRRREVQRADIAAAARFFALLAS